uniref:Uncharacterized protein n=1 Tax=Pseudo-nitzschia delicatissima TaxID=44447 RepID=A0A7S0XQA4_9STRA|mmetsp:Transcript_2015/g.4729  ORF Transcript_2015/g.4729 Transcript_2015/m.4729 type:complete len:467 (+) Transcript_2015:244-1644(+)
MAIEEYLNANILRVESTKARTRKLQEIGNGYVPSFQGYLHLDFSVHVPCSFESIERCQLSVNDDSQARLESLVMLFLCSQEVELVVSTAPDQLLQVCPFDSSAAQAQENKNTMVVWNLPRFDAKTIAFEDPDNQLKIQDMKTNTTIILELPQQYYTRLHFTYPVYQWGALNSEKADSLQEQFEETLVSTGTLDSLLPWPNAIAAATGQEPYVFWDEPTPAPVREFDTTIPLGATLVLRWTGIGMMIANTLLLLGLTTLLHLRNKKPKKKNLDNWKAEYLDTEAGVSAILMESKHYALTKSYQQRGDRNISGVEVDLKMADHPLQLLESKSSSSVVSNHSSHRSIVSNHSSHRSVHSNRSPMLQPLQSPPSPISSINSNSPAKSLLQTKEDLLLARVKMIQGSGNSTPWFTDHKNNLLQKQNSEIDDDAESDEDLQILDLIKTNDGSDSRTSSKNEMIQDISGVGSF